MRRWHTHIFHDDVIGYRDNLQYSETRFKAVGSRKLCHYLYLNLVIFTYFGVEGLTSSEPPNLLQDISESQFSEPPTEKGL